MRRHTTGHIRTAQQGAGLIEIMVAVLVFSIGLIGIVRLQVGAMRDAQGAYMSNQAAVLAYAMLDALRADRQAATSGSYNLSKTCDASTISLANGLAQDTWSTWLLGIKATLGDHAGSCGEVSCSGTACTVRVYWDDTRATTGETATSVEVRTQL
ncbi:MAG: type IV pilus modification protein PilV [Tepidimonas ignava]|uniref:type IV pilus modification protein PilV n=1 Tax=Tepidimonas ignava TaxID=114249 RepID=UPI00391DC1B5